MMSQSNNHTLAKASIEAIVFHHWVQTLWWRTEYRVYLTVYIQLWHLLSYSHLNITVWTDNFCRATLRNYKRPCTHKAKAMLKRWTRYACFSSCVMRFVMATIFFTGLPHILAISSVQQYTRQCSYVPAWWEYSPAPPCNRPLALYKFLAQWP